MASEVEADVTGDLDDSGCIQDDMHNGYPHLSLMDMPDDVLLIILQYCTAPDLKALGYCCARLCRLVQERRLWRRVDARGQRCSLARLRWLLDNVLHDGTRHLLLHGYAEEAEGCMGYMKMAREEGERIYRSEDNWDRVDLYVQKLRVVRDRALKTKCPGLVTWPDGCQGRGRAPGCTGPQFSVQAPLLAALAATCPQLSVLHLDYCNIDCKQTNLDQFPKTLKELSMRGSKCYNMVLWDKTFLFSVNTHLPNLEVVDVSECAWMEPATLLPLSKLRALTELRMRDCVKLSEFVAYASITARYGFRALESLDLRGSPVGDSEISALGWLPRLQRLWLAHESSVPPPRFSAQHSHFMDDPLVPHVQLHPWEEQESHLFAERPERPCYVDDELQQLDECVGVKRKPEDEQNGDVTPAKCQKTDDTRHAFKVPSAHYASPKRKRKSLDGDDVRNIESKYRVGLKESNIGTDSASNSSNDFPTNGESSQKGNAGGKDDADKSSKSDNDDDDDFDDGQGAIRVGHGNKKTLVIEISLNKHNRQMQSENRNTEDDESDSGNKDISKSRESGECSVSKDSEQSDSAKRSEESVGVGGAGAESKGSGEMSRENPPIGDGENYAQQASGRIDYIGITFRLASSREDAGAGAGGDPDAGGYVRFRRNQQPVIVPARTVPTAERQPEEPSQEPMASSSREPPQPAEPGRPQDQVQYRMEPAHHVLYVNVGQQMNTYRFPRAGTDVSELINGPRHVDRAALVTDFAIRRFGRADGPDLSVINIGPEPASARPDRSSLRYLSVRGYRHVTDRALAHLAAAAPQLQHLDVSGSGVTPAGAQRFREQRPDCTLVGDPEQPQETPNQMKTK